MNAPENTKSSNSSQRSARQRSLPSIVFREKHFIDTTAGVFVRGPNFGIENLDPGQMSRIDGANLLKRRPKDAGIM